MIQMHRVSCAQTKRRERQKQNHNFAGLDSSMLRGRRNFCLKPANLVAFKLSVFESRRISFLKIFLINHRRRYLYFSRFTGPPAPLGGGFARERRAHIPAGGGRRGGATEWRDVSRHCSCRLGFCGLSRFLTQTLAGG